MENTIRLQTFNIFVGQGILPSPAEGTKEALSLDIWGQDLIRFMGQDLENFVGLNL